MAVDFLDAEESTTIRRNGDPVEFLSYLDAIDIMKVIWHRYFPENFPNQKAYDRLGKVLLEQGKNWAISEHMTFKGSDYVAYWDEEFKEVLFN